MNCGVTRSSMEYIIDGYNLLHKLFEDTIDRPLEHMRERTESLLMNFQVSEKTRVTIVYDGQNTRRKHHEHGVLNRIFTRKGQTADDWIIDCLSSLDGSASELTIVSSDRYICRHASAYGASYMLSETFIKTCIAPGREEKRDPENGFYRKKYDQGHLHQKEVDRWLALFGKSKG